MVSPGPGPETRTRSVLYHLRRTVSSRWCSTRATLQNLYGGQPHRNASTAGRQIERQTGVLQLQWDRQVCYNYRETDRCVLTCLFRPGSGDTSWKTATRPDAVPTATRSSKQLSSLTAVIASLFPWNTHTHTHTHTHRKSHCVWKDVFKIKQL